MEKIKSFTVNHLKLKSGLYVSRIDNFGTDITTFDMRFTAPNIEPVMDTGSIHTLEHLGATFFRNSNIKNSVVYFGPMGCRTGFYLLTTNMTKDDAKNLLIESLKKVQDFDHVPGAQKIECGNYLEHDLDGAKKECAKYLDLLLSL